MRRHQQALLTMLFALAPVGCAGGHGSLAANSAKYPVSMSDTVRDPDGKPLARDDLKEVGKINTDYHSWSMFWNMIPLSGERDISEEINSQVQAAGGEAVVDLAVTSSNCTWNFFTIIGFLPDCASVEVEGRIVKRQNTAKPAAKPAASPTPTAPEPAKPADAAKPDVAAAATPPLNVAAADAATPATTPTSGATPAMGATPVATPATTAATADAAPPPSAAPPNAAPATTAQSPITAPPATTAPSTAKPPAAGATPKRPVGK